MKPDKPHCKDCKAETPDDPPWKWRAAPYPGPRCASHWRPVRDARKDRAHELSVQRTYGLSEGAYEDLYVWQGSRCALCRRATGATRRLSVDHDHKTGAVRGLLCRPCNTVLGRAGDDPAWFERGAAYLRQPPYGRMMNGQPGSNMPDV